MPLLAATSEEGGGSFLVTPNVGLMIWTLLAFGITLWILWKLAFPRIGEALDRRQRVITESIDTAERWCEAWEIEAAGRGLPRDATTGRVARGSQPSGRRDDRAGETDMRR